MSCSKCGESRYWSPGTGCYVCNREEKAVSAEREMESPVPDFQLAFIRWSVVHRSWHDLCGGMPTLEGFLAGWFCRVCEAEPPVVVGRFRDSFNCGWREAHGQIEILSRKGK